MADLSLELLIRVQDEATRQVQHIQSQLDRVAATASAVGRASGELSRAHQVATQALDRQQQGLDRTSLRMMRYQNAIENAAATVIGQFSPALAVAFQRIDAIGDAAARAGLSIGTFGARLGILAAAVFVAIQTVQHMGRVLQQVAQETVQLQRAIATVDLSGLIRQAGTLSAEIQARVEQSRTMLGSLLVAGRQIWEWFLGLLGLGVPLAERIERVSRALIELAPRAEALQTITGQLLILRGELERAQARLGEPLSAAEETRVRARIAQLRSELAELERREQAARQEVERRQLELETAGLRPEAQQAARALLEAQQAAQRRVLELQQETRAITDAARERAERRERELGEARVALTRHIAALEAQLAEQQASRIALRARLEREFGAAVADTAAQLRAVLAEEQRLERERLAQQQALERAEAAARAAAAPPEQRARILETAALGELRARQQLMAQQAQEQRDLHELLGRQMIARAELVAELMRLEGQWVSVLEEESGALRAVHQSGEPLLASRQRLLELTELARMGDQQAVKVLEELTRATDDQAAALARRLAASRALAAIEAERRQREDLIARAETAEREAALLVADRQTRLALELRAIDEERIRQLERAERIQHLEERALTMRAIEAEAALRRQQLLIPAVEAMDPLAGFRRGLREALDEFAQAGDAMRRGALEIAQAMSRHFSESFFAVITGQFRRLRELPRELAVSIVRAITDALGGMAARSVLQRVGQLVGLPATAMGLGAVSWIPVSVTQAEAIARLGGVIASHPTLGLVTPAATAAPAVPVGGGLVSMPVGGGVVSVLPSTVQAGLAIPLASIGTGAAVVSGGQLIHSGAELALIGQTAPGVVGAGTTLSAGQVLGVVGGVAGVGLAGLGAYQVGQTSGTAAGAVTGLVTGALAGAVFGPVGAVVGAVIGLIAGLLGGLGGEARQRQQQRRAERRAQASELGRAIEQAIEGAATVEEALSAPLPNTQTVGTVLASLAAFYHGVGAADLSGVLEGLAERGWAPAPFVPFGRLTNIAEFAGNLEVAMSTDRRGVARWIEQLWQGLESMAAREARVSVGATELVMPARAGLGPIERMTVVPYPRRGILAGRDLVVFGQTLVGLPDSVKARFLEELARVDADQHLRILYRDDDVDVPVSIWTPPPPPPPPSPSREPVISQPLMPEVEPVVENISPGGL